MNFIIKKKIKDETETIIYSIVHLQRLLLSVALVMIFSTNYQITGRS